MYRVSSRTEPIYAGTGSTRAWSPLGSEAALREAASLPLARWRAPAIIAWLELALGMPQYAVAVADNVKSGKVTLVSDPTSRGLSSDAIHSDVGKRLILLQHFNVQIAVELKF